MPEYLPVPNGADPDVHWAVEDVRGRADAYRLYRAYYNGEHNLAFATEKFRNAFGALFQEFADNICDDVVDEPVDRMQFVGWSGTTTDITAAAQEQHDLNRLDGRLGEVHRNGWREGDGFVIISQDPDDVVRWYVQDPRQMAVQYDADRPDRIVKAAKVWKVGKAWRCTIYYDDGRITRWATKGSTNGGGLPTAAAFQPFTEVRMVNGETEEVAAEQETDADRCPVFHYPGGEIGKYGRSVLKDVIPLQDALNKAVLDMLVGMEFHALPQRWATGVVLEKDDQGNEIDPWTKGENRVWTTGNDKAALGQFPAADLAAMLEVQDGFRLEIARKGAIPPHSVNLRSGGQVPSGVALLVAEGKTIKRVKDHQRDWGATHRDAMAFALRLGGISCESRDLEIEWAPVETRDEKALLEGLVIKRELGVSDRQILLEAGYDTSLVEDFLAEKEANRARMEQTMAAGSGGALGRTQGDSEALALLGLPRGPQSPNGAQGTALTG